MMTSDREFLGISEASRFLGVSESALRQWTDEGDIKVFLTPGGQRRYAKSELKRFITANHTSLGVKDLASQIEDTAAAHRQIDSMLIKEAARYNVDVGSQVKLAEMGRVILALIVKCVSEPARREETMKSIREAGAGFGEVTASLGMSLTDSIEAFIKHRDPMMRVTTEMMKKGDRVNRRVVESIPVVDRAMDEALLALVAAHQKHRPTT